jgi:hypothetical protein
MKLSLIILVLLANYTNSLVPFEVDIVKNTHQNKIVSLYYYKWPVYYGQTLTIDVVTELCRGMGDYYKDYVREKCHDFDCVYKYCGDLTSLIEK